MATAQVAAAENTKADRESSRLSLLAGLQERATGLEPATSSLGSRPVYSLRCGYRTVL